MKAHARWSKLCVVALAVLGAFAAACLPPAPGTGSGSRPTPAADFSGDVTGLPRDRILSYARSLRYDTSSAASDTLTFSGGAGPFVMLHPEVGAGLVADEVLGTGRVIGRISSTGALPRLGLSRGYTYYWVDSLGGRWRAVMIPEDPGVAVSVLPMVFGSHRYAARAPAHFAFQSDSFANGRCGTRCCRPGERMAVDTWLHRR